MTEIVVRYVAFDGWCETRKFKTLARARKFAIRCVGENPKIRSRFASDGFGKITVEGVSLYELLGRVDDQL